MIKFSDQNVITAVKLLPSVIQIFKATYSGLFRPQDGSF